MLSFDPDHFRAAFPFFQQHPTAVYLDSAATTLRPNALIEATTQFYCSAGSVHRSQYDWQQTQLFEQARQQVAQFIQAEDESCIVWTSGTTHSINSIAYGLAHLLHTGDQIILSSAEHHANFVVWQQLALQHNLTLTVLPLQADYQIDLAALTAALSSKTKIVALNFVSNVTGYRQPIEQCSALIRQLAPQALIIVDAAQAVLHQSIALQQLDVDFLAFSAHKLFGPTGLGVLAGKKSALQQLTPLFFGGKMVQQVTDQYSTFQELPYRLEAGTPNIAAVIGFGAVLQWLQQYDFHQLMQHTQQLAEQCRQRLSQYYGCKLFSASESHIISFIFTDIDNSDLATLLSEQQIALRTGQHCAQPYLHFLQQRGTLRLSLAPYNNQHDLNLFFHALNNALTLLEE
ncbi:aminotransferase class V-fold PLP-dependent enzyme [Gallibacterium trehalosifermentans]|uniref:Probable cysteine desulfurase n=1 Tax=Gallibacterium trehalosifermentans TaxID=516935 RepID=A0ABV6GYV4_9PAST